MSTMRMETSQQPTYLLLVLSGLEFLVEQEIRAKLQVEYLEICSVKHDPQKPHINVMQGEAAVGRILLRTASPPEHVKKLQSVQSVLAFLAKSDDIITDRVDGVNQVAELVMAADWTSALQLWKVHAIQPTDKPTFRGSCVRDGKHAYKSVDIAGEIGGCVIDQFGWEVNLTTFDIEIVCILFHNYMVAGISLADTTKSQFRSRLANEDRSTVTDDAHYVSTLRPSTAFLMFQLAQYQVGDVFLDSMCGVGTIPICCVEYAEKRVFALGGEIDPLPVGKAGQNARSHTRPVEIAQWDSTQLPLRSATIDKVLVDMPFGVRCGNHRINNKIYPKIMKELLRILRDGGRAVILVMSKKLFRSAIQHLQFTMIADYDVNIGGLGGGIYVLEKRNSSPCATSK